mmetsp:Transcript_78415/g.221800  ORF Transcript_78415/g.221800 Transcript_78415/m.221800 type:complete len:281 (+) Transcript_78415:785-1627(+)
MQAHLCRPPGHLRQGHQAVRPVRRDAVAQELDDVGRARHDPARGDARPLQRVPHARGPAGGEDQGGGAREDKQAAHGEDDRGRPLRHRLLFDLRPRLPAGRLQHKVPGHALRREVLRPVQLRGECVQPRGVVAPHHLGRCGQASVLQRQHWSYQDVQHVPSLPHLHDHEHLPDGHPRALRQLHGHDAHRSLRRPDVRVARAAARGVDDGEPRDGARGLRLPRSLRHGRERRHALGLQADSAWFSGVHPRGRERPQPVCSADDERLHLADAQSAPPQARLR